MPNAKCEITFAISLVWLSTKMARLTVALVVILISELTTLGLAFGYLWYQSTLFPWNMLSTIIAATSAIIAATVLVFAVLSYRRVKRQDALDSERKERLKDPFEVHFLIPNAMEHKVSYYQQDSEEHHVDELRLSSNSEVDIVVWMKPRLNIVLSQLQFGCIGPDNDAKPEPLYYFNWWVKEGPRKKITPEDDKGQYRDITNYYHIMYYDRAMPKDEIHLPGLRIRTKKKGTYDFWIGIIMPEGRADKTLKINVV